MNRIELGLDRIQALLSKLGNPERHISPVFHIAGTNGKGSVSAFLRYILEESGYVVHRNTSPHLVRFNERIEVCGKEIEDSYYNELASECRYTMEKNKLDASYFEIIVVIALMAFSRNESDATIMEVGMGGRLDATNVIENPLVSIITPISLDHVESLGDTVEKIAGEKMGIAKKNRPVVVSNQPEGVLRVIDARAKSLNCPVYSAGADWECRRFDDFCEFSGFGRRIRAPLPALEGAHQVMNAGTAIAALLSQDRIPVDESSISRGLQKVVWRARLQNLAATKLQEYVERDSELYLDGGHNEGCAHVLADWLREKDSREKRDNVLIICMLKRKNSRAFIEVIGRLFSTVIVVSNANEAYLEAEEFVKEFNDMGLDVYGTCSNAEDSLRMARSVETGGKKRILICGSFYFCGEVLALLEPGRNN
ncbi:MAG: bifunctional folylpolyglutamate synthase/dihydrofolate synthase [Rickettsiales bacterium]|jgi:dihydrofolate synthase/folylpolyglutamate synthase|nr:bifunctional folylpolyglutamate synthase/dihydrofolate synthase [Rickettsiales bacterium]